MGSFLSKSCLATSVMAALMLTAGINARQRSPSQTKLTMAVMKLEEDLNRILKHHRHRGLGLEEQLTPTACHEKLVGCFGDDVELASEEAELLAASEAALAKAEEEEDKVVAHDSWIVYALDSVEFDAAAAELALHKAACKANGGEWNGDAQTCTLPAKGAGGVEEDAEDTTQKKSCLALLQDMGEGGCFGAAQIVPALIYENSAQVVPFNNPVCPEGSKWIETRCVKGAGETVKVETD